MKRKLFADQVNVLWQKIYSRHILVDRELLTSLPGGELRFDCLTGEAVHDSIGSLTTNIGPHLASWLRSVFTQNHVPDEYVISATLAIRIQPDLPHPTDELGFLDRWSARAEIVTQDRTYSEQVGEYGDLRPSFASE